MNRPDLYRRAITRWGVDAQLDQAQEEFAEGVVAISHYRRRRVDARQVADELADIRIMCEQVAFALDISAEVEEAITRKLARLDARVRE